MKIETEELNCDSVLKETPTICQPKPYKMHILVWSDLTLDVIESISVCNNYDHVRQVLASIFNLDNSIDNLKDGTILDLYYYTLQFARDEHFSAEKTSTFFSIIKRVFEVCIETPYDNLNDTFKYFKELLFCHAVNQPPTSIELFTHDEVVKITNYTLNTFFRHFKLYKYVFTPAVRLDLSFNYIGILPTPPLSQADVKEDGINDAEERSGEGNEEEEIDDEKLIAQEELRKIVTDFLTKEANKIEGNIDQHLKAAVDALNAKIDPLVDTGQKLPKGKKK